MREKIELILERFVTYVSFTVFEHNSPLPFVEKLTSYLCYLALLDEVLILPGILIHLDVFSKGAFNSLYPLHSFHVFFISADHCLS